MPKIFFLEFLEIEYSFLVQVRAITFQLKYSLVTPQMQNWKNTITQSGEDFFNFIHAGQTAKLIPAIDFYIKSLIAHFNEKYLGIGRGQITHKCQFW